MQILVIVTWTYTLGEGNILRVSENRALIRECGRKRDEVTGSWRRVRNEEINNFYSSQSFVVVMKSRRMAWVGCVALM
jgi:hypothetical protein